MPYFQRCSSITFMLLMTLDSYRYTELLFHAEVVALLTLLLNLNLPIFNKSIRICKPAQADAATGWLHWLDSQSVCRLPVLSKHHQALATYWIHTGIKKARCTPILSLWLVLFNTSVCCPRTTISSWRTNKWWGPPMACRCVRCAWLVLRYSLP